MFLIKINNIKLMMKKIIKIIRNYKSFKVNQPMQRVTNFCHR